MRVLDLFSGIGGFSLGLERTGGFETVAFCEIDPYAQRVLRKHWPEVPIYEDVRTLTGERLAADGIAVDVITGGFPCQDLSVAGKRAGIDGERSGLWSEIVRLAGDLRPRFIILENVANLLAGPSEKRGAWFGRVLGDLARLGYDAEWENIPAAAVGAPHRRERVWIVAHPERSQQPREESLCGGAFGMGREFQSVPWNRTPERALREFRRVDDGLSYRVDRTDGIRNAVVPQIPEMIGRAILEAGA
jgi:DNA (cytosine-5)-methyltransferase 1